MKQVWEWWKSVGKKVGDLQARGLLILFYFVVLTPFALAVRWLGDPLAIKQGASRGWSIRDDAAGNPMMRAKTQS